MANTNNTSNLHTTQHLENYLSGIASLLSSVKIKQLQTVSEFTELATAYEKYSAGETNIRSTAIVQKELSDLEKQFQLSFANNTKVRQHTLRLLQGIEYGIINQQDVEAITEDVIFNTPNYWLASALVVIASWLKNDKPAADRALKESLRRDDYNTSLFFVLVLPLLDRDEAALQWLTYFLELQNPFALRREFAVLLETFVFDNYIPGSKALLHTYMQKWLRKVSAKQQLQDEQIVIWNMYFFSSYSFQSSKEFEVLATYSPSWPQIKEAIQFSHSHQPIEKRLITQLDISGLNRKEIKENPSELLNLLISNYSDEELPLQEKIRYNQLLLFNKGNLELTNAVLTVEQKVFTEKQNLLALLSGMAIDPDLYGITPFGCALATAYSAPLIEQSYNKYAIIATNSIPESIGITVNEQVIKTSFGNDKDEQMRNYASFWATVLKNTKARERFNYSNLILPVIVFAIGIWLGQYKWWVGAIPMAIACAILAPYLYKHYNKLKYITAQVKREEIKMGSVFKNCLDAALQTSLLIYQEDEKSTDCKAFLKTITVNDIIED